MKPRITYSGQRLLLEQQLNYEDADRLQLGDTPGQGTPATGYDVCGPV